jgi:predicted DNA-binding transcriptional regulator AlpA
MNTNPTIDDDVSTTRDHVDEENPMPQPLSDTADLGAINPLLTRSDLQRLLRLSDRTIRRLVSSGEFPRPIKLGGTHRWRREDIRAFLDRLAETEISPTDADTGTPAETTANQQSA